MGWTRFDDGLPDHPKVDRMLDSDELQGLAALGLWLLMACRASQQLTDGLVLRRQVARLAPERGGDLVTVLLENGLLDRHDDGHQVHDYLDWNPSREEVLARRQRDSERKARGRTRQGDKDSEGTSGRSPRGVRADGRGESGVLSDGPDPTRPDRRNPPSPPEGGTAPPARPRSGRARDVEQWRRSVSAWAEGAFPAMSEPERSQLVQRAIAHGAPSVVGVRELLVRWGVSEEELSDRG